MRFANYAIELPESSPVAGRAARVILGIRPTDFQHGAGADPGLPRIRVRPDVVEDLGSEHHLIFAVDAPRVSAEAVRAATESADGDEVTLLADDRASFTARLDARRTIAPGTEVELALDHRRFHFFEPSTGAVVDGSRRATLVA